MTTAVASAATFTLRPAREVDVALLLAMIRELAEFEQLDHELEVTEDLLRAALFGEDAVARAFIAWMNSGEVAGYAVFYRTFSTFAGRPGIFLDDLYVRPAFRRLGIGRALLTRVAQTGMELGGGRFEWITLRWNESAFRFYRSIGASVMSEWALLRMNGKEVRNLVNAKVKVAA
jgi:ribosomal protein S18 acetylase RimI-like enzyme